MKTSIKAPSPAAKKNHLTRFERMAARAEKRAAQHGQAAARPDRPRCPFAPPAVSAAGTGPPQRAPQGRLAGARLLLRAGRGRLQDVCLAGSARHPRQGNATKVSWELYEAARREAGRIVKLVRHAIAVKDPVNQALRHTRSSVSPTLEKVLREGDPISYARPESIQSDQSLAAYLKTIYELARTEITIEDPLFRLDGRRPDLAEIELSEDNLKREITTLELVNEVLLAQLRTSGVELPASLLQTRFYPPALPFHGEHERVRSALSQMGQQSLNELGAAARPDDFAIHQPDFTLVPNAADALNLLGVNQAGAAIMGNEMMLLSRPGTQGSVSYHHRSVWYPLSRRAEHP